MNDIVKKVIILSIPSKKITLEKCRIADKAIDLVKNQTMKYKQITNVEFGGSYAKGTWLSTDADIDIFIKFDSTTTRSEFINITKLVGFNSLKKFCPHTRYSEHPYVEATIKKTKINVVPCYDVKLGKWKSSADRSTFHTKFMSKSLTDKMKNDVRLLKVFLKNNEMYGSEMAKQGFSGYVSEVLIHNFGNFQNTINSIAKLKHNTIIGKTTKKFNTAVTIIDPIDENRNLAAAISVENIGKMIMTCRSFLNNPSITFFKQKITKITPNIRNVIIIKFHHKIKSPDIIWGQIKKTSKSLSTQIKSAGFEVLRYTAFTDEKNNSNLLFLIKETMIEKYYVKGGPNFFSEFDCNKFIIKNKKNKLIWINDDGKIYTLKKRRYTDIKLFLQQLLKDNLKKIGIPNDLKDDIKNGFIITYGNKVKCKLLKDVLVSIASTNERIFSSSL